MHTKQFHILGYCPNVNSYSETPCTCNYISLADNVHTTLEFEYITSDPLYSYYNRQKKKKALFLVTVRVIKIRKNQNQPKRKI